VLKPRARLAEEEERRERFIGRKLIRYERAK